MPLHVHCLCIPCVLPHLGSEIFGQSNFIRMRWLEALRPFFAWVNAVVRASALADGHSLRLAAVSVHCQVASV